MDGGLVDAAPCVEACFSGDFCPCSTATTFDVVGVVASMGSSSFVVTFTTVFFVDESILLFRLDEDADV